MGKKSPLPILASIRLLNSPNSWPNYLFTYSKG